MKFFNEMKDYNRQKCVPTTIIISQVTHKQVGVCVIGESFIYKHKYCVIMSPIKCYKFLLIITKKNVHVLAFFYIFMRLVSRI